MPWLKNIQSLTLTINLPLTQTRLILLPNEISRELTDEESLEVEVQRSVRKRAALLLDTLDTADVCSQLLYKGMVSRAVPFPTNPRRGWIIVSDTDCITPDGDPMEAGQVAMYTGIKWLVYCGD
jgi:hypothetical protein